MALNTSILYTTTSWKYETCNYIWVNSLKTHFKLNFEFILSWVWVTIILQYYYNFSNQSFAHWKWEKIENQVSILLHMAPGLVIILWLKMPLMKDSG